GCPGVILAPAGRSRPGVTGYGRAGARPADPGGIFVMAVDQGGPGAEAPGAGHAEADRPAADPAPPAGAPGDAADPANIATQQDFGRERTRAGQRAGLTVREVARAARIPASTAGDYFAGRHLPPPSQPG